jgi:plasmid stabilization system protein ParE
MSRYSVAPKARNDLDAIWDYIGIENSDPAAADRLIEEFFCAFTVLGSQPSMAEQCHEF